MTDIDLEYTPILTPISQPPAVEALDRVLAAGDALVVLVTSHIAQSDCYQRNDRIAEWDAARAGLSGVKP
jgi:hypothetical protein